MRLVAIMVATGRWDHCSGNSPARLGSNSVREFIIPSKFACLVQEFFHLIEVAVVGVPVEPLIIFTPLTNYRRDSITEEIIPLTIYRRDSITEEIIITSTTNSSLSNKLLTIQEAAGSLEQSSVSISTSSNQNASTTAGGSPPTVGAAPGANESNGSNLSLNQAATSTSPGSSSSAANTAASGATPSITIVSSDSSRDQPPQQSQSVESNGFTAPGDSPSSRKSSTSSKGKASQAKLSTSSSGRDEVSGGATENGIKETI